MISKIIRRDDGAVLTRLSSGVRGIAVQRDGEKLDKESIAKILADARAGKVDKPIEFDARVYRQKLGEPLTPNRSGMQQNILFRPRGMRAHARSYRGRPFLDGHDWGATRSRGGTIDDSSAEFDGEDADTAEVKIVQTINASEPWAVAGVLGGTITEFSIGAAITGEIHCSIHQARVWSKCYCMPGEKYGDEPLSGESDDRPVAQWLIQSADGVEVSSVNVPAVGNGATGIDSVRAGLDMAGLSSELGKRSGDQLAGLIDLINLASGSGIPAVEIREAISSAGRTNYDSGNRATFSPRSRPPMSKYLKLAAALTLTVPPGEDLDEGAVIASIDGIRAERDLYQTRATAAEAKLAEIEASAQARELDSVIASAYDAGKLVRKADADGKTAADPQEASLRRIGAGLGLDAVKAHVGAMPALRPARASSVVNSVPAGAAPGEPVITDAIREAARQMGLDPADVAANLARSGRV